MKEVAQILEEYSLIPSKKEGAKNEESQKFHHINPYEARAIAATEECNNYTLGRALFHMAKGRGLKATERMKKKRRLQLA